MYGCPRHAIAKSSLAAPEKIGVLEIHRWTFPKKILKSPQHMVQERLKRFLDGGISVIVGTVDGDGVPTCCRAIAIRSKDDFETITVYVPAATAGETVANLATTRRIAVSCTEPLSHNSIQLKGLTRGVKLAPSEDREFVSGRLEAFAECLGDFGLPRTVTRRLSHWPAFAIEIAVEQFFDQTPGPRAGEELR
jgi:hypothetical protein